MFVYTYSKFPPLFLQNICYRQYTIQYESKPLWDAMKVSITLNYLKFFSTYNYTNNIPAHVLYQIVLRWHWNQMSGQEKTIFWLFSLSCKALPKNKTKTRDVQSVLWNRFKCQEGKLVLDLRFWSSDLLQIVQLKSDPMIVLRRRLKTDLGWHSLKKW